MYHCCLAGCAVGTASLTPCSSRILPVSTRDSEPFPTPVSPPVHLLAIWSCFRPALHNLVSFLHPSVHRFRQLHTALECDHTTLLSLPSVGAYFLASACKAVSANPLLITLCADSPTHVDPRNPTPSIVVSQANFSHVLGLAEIAAVGSCSVVVLASIAVEVVVDRPHHQDHSGRADDADERDDLWVL